MRSQYAFTQNAMATLSSTDKLEYYWPAMQGAASYVVRKPILSETIPTAFWNADD
ncbi:MAG: hypothetical protein U0Y68_18465 [Blastocatellia bacterium]